MRGLTVRCTIDGPHVTAALFDATGPRGIGGGITCVRRPVSRVLIHRIHRVVNSRFHMD